MTSRAQALSGLHLAELETREVFGIKGFTVTCLSCNDRSTCFESQSAALRWNARHAERVHGIAEGA
jgi:hypothetical protein